jgi:transposase-like protein
MLSSGRSMAQVVQHLGVSEQTFHRWRNQYGGMKSEEARRLKELEVENALLKRLVAEEELDISILREANEYLGNRKPLVAAGGSGLGSARLPGTIATTPFAGLARVSPLRASCDAPTRCCAPCSQAKLQRSSGRAVRSCSI